MKLMSNMLECNICFKTNRTVWDDLYWTWVFSSECSLWKVSI